MCINLGTGNGYSILDLVKTFEKVNDITIPFEFCERRKGDIEQIYANTKLAEKLLSGSLSLEDMCLSSWHRVKKQTVSFYNFLFFIVMVHHFLY